ncbi:hypothetical protein L6164_009598 [Bauhinia variegata]|uniref:Uncharacterized protein n=1 Tax=Bauhinia variegata TaxID=167791 RepID=A0ACB9PKL5_BAUVA|nr:hypothetical protein L6164_009598 [Bauhinia variegata]
MLAYHCDLYVSKGMKIHKDGGLESILLRSRCHKGLLLHYFPAEKGTSDHGSLTSDPHTFVDLSVKIEEGFRSNGLGILSVTGC